MVHNVSCFVTSKFPFVSMLPSITIAGFSGALSPYRHLFQESEDRLASAFQMTERLQQSLDSANEALKTSVTPICWALGFENGVVAKGTVYLELSGKACFGNLVVHCSGRYRVITIWRTGSGDKSPRTLVCFVCPMVCHLMYTVSMFVWMACTKMLVRKKLTGKTIQV